MKKTSSILMRIILPMILICVLFGCQATGEKQADKATPQYAHPEAIVSTNWLQAHLNDNNIRIVDCTVSFINPKSYVEGHIPGAVSLDVIGPLSDPNGRLPMLILPASDFESLMGKLGISNNTTVVVYDSFGGTWSARLWWALKYYGHTDVKILNGGLVAWKTEGKRLEINPISPESTVFKANVQPNYLSELEDVKMAIDQDNIYLVDALNVEHHTGKMPFHPSIAPAGHIPTAINVPGPSNINMETGLFLSPVDLKKHWNVLKAKPDNQVITYCGGGYYGAFDLFALYQLGYERISLYDGSWIEWISDPSRPVATN